MALTKITYTDKVALSPQPSVADVNKVSDSDMNQIKSVVNDAIDQVDTNTSNISNIGTYSTSEEVVVGKWIDNKPIYKKTVYVASLPNATSVDYNHNIANVDTIWIDISSSFIKWANGATSPFNYLGTNSANPTLNTAIEVRLANATKFSIETYNADRTSLSAYVTLLYTKTTD